MCFVFIWEQTATCATYNINWLVFIIETKSVYSAVRTGYLNKSGLHFVFKRLRKKPVKCYILSTLLVLCGAETWTLGKADQKHLESFEMWCRRRLEKIGRTDRVKNEEILHKVKEEINVLHTIRRRKVNPLKPELNPICYLLALLGAHHFLHVSRIRVKLLTFRLLMSYIYGALILDVSRSHTTTQHSR